MYQKIEKRSGESLMTISNGDTDDSDKKSIHEIISDSNSREASPNKAHCNNNSMFDINMISIDSNIRIDENDKLLIPENLIRDDEKDKITFTRNGIANFIANLALENEGKWTPLYNKDNLVLHYKTGSVFAEKFLLGKMHYSMSKAQFSKPLDYETITKIMYQPEHRTKYDTSLKELKIYEKGEHYFVFRAAFHKPIFFISEREVVDKRVSFKKDNVYYSIASSIDNYLPANDSIVRMFTYLNALILTEDENNFYFDTYAQIDAKTILPEKIINITIPQKTTEWFKNFIREIKSTLEACE